MSAEFQELLKKIASCSKEQKQEIFSHIRESIQLHKLEEHFNVRAEIILESIIRASDLTQRGIRGVIAETIFLTDLLPKAKNWDEEECVGNLSYDACAIKGAKKVRIQVKMQRKLRGEPMKKGDNFVVEVQRTRTGSRNGNQTRPYRFDEFDLLAVCMEPSVRRWSAFMYIPTSKLQPRKSNAALIDILQPVPPYSEGESGNWSGTLDAALEKFENATTSKDAKRN